MPLTGPAIDPLPLWLEPGPELVDVLAGDGMSGIGDGVSAALKQGDRWDHRGEC